MLGESDALCVWELDAIWLAVTLALDACDGVALADCVVDCVGDWDRVCDADGVGASLGLPVTLGVDVELLVDEALALLA